MSQEHHGHAHHQEDHGHDKGAGLLRFIQELNPFSHSHNHTETTVDAALETSARGIWALKVSLVALGVTAFLQLLVVLLSGSAALFADTIHNFSDALTAVPLWIAFALGRRRASGRYTYGLGRAEDLAGIAIVLMIFLSAILALLGSIDRIVNPQEISQLGLVAIAGLLGFLGNEAVAVFRIRVGREIGSAALIVDGQHARVDGFTSLAVVLGAAGVWLGFPLADPIVGLLITLAILVIVKDTALTMFYRMMDAIDPEVVKAMERTATAVSGVEAVSMVRARWNGHRIQSEIHVVVNEDLPTWKSHQIAELVRRDLFDGIPTVGSITVHCDPCGHSGTDHHRATAHHESATYSRDST